MATKYRGNRIIYGSWLMDEKALLSLEDVANDIFSYLYDIQEKNIAQCKDEQKSNSYYDVLSRSTHKPSIRITFTDGTKKEVASFKDIFDLLEIRGCLVNKIQISIKCLGTNIDLTLSSGETSSNYFKYEVTGSEQIYDYDSYKNIEIGKIENWIDEHKPDLLLTAWYELSRWSIPTIFFLFFITFLAMSLYTNRKEQYFTNFDAEIAEILETGITNENRDRAIQLILIKEYNYVPTSWTQKSSEAGDKVLICCAIGMLLCLFIRFRPRANFSIGKGKKRVKFWLKYKYFVFVALPTMFIIPVLINILV